MKAYCRLLFILGMFSCLLRAPTVLAATPLVTLEGDLPSATQQLVQDVLGTVDAPPISRAQARRRGERARRQTLTVLRSQGYYGAAVDLIIRQNNSTENRLDRSDLVPVLAIETGPQFLLGDLSVTLSNISEKNKKTLDPPLSIETGQPAMSADIVATELQLVRWLKAQGYPDAIALPRKALVDHADHTLSVEFNLSVGDKTRFGSIRLAGTAQIDDSWPELIAPFKAGDLFQEDRFKLLPKRVLSTNAFGGVVARFDDNRTAQTDGSVVRDIILNVEAGQQNTISAEIGLSTTEGGGIDLIYERRNVAGKAETLSVSATVKTNQIGLGLDYNIPYFMQWQRSLVLKGEIAREDTDAFTGERASGSFVIAQRLSSKLSVGLGGGLEASQFDQDGTSTTAYLFEGLGRATFDSRDDILNARDGLHIEARATPVFNFGEEEGFFTSIEAGVSAYQSVSETVTLATRVKAGSLFGADQATVPLNRRFYGGGGGSVRGFGFQSISPVNSSGDLIGGRSIAEVSAELRYKGESNFGAAVFIDAASVGQDDWPTFSDVRYGAGIGLRYHTAFAPLRADIAIPLNKRPQDDDFQIYISIGQAF